MNYLIKAFHLKNTCMYVAVGLLLVSCSKELRRSKKLMKGEKWEVSSISINGVASEIAGTWNVTPDVDIYDSVPSVTWVQAEMDAVFQWQFQDKGNSFQLQFEQQCLECDGEDLDTLDYFANNITGKYAVEKHGRNKMTFSSTSTSLYAGSEVRINLERIK